MATIYSLTHVEVVLVVLEVLLGEKLAEARVAERISLVRAQLEHRDDVGRGEVQALDLAVESRLSVAQGGRGELAGGRRTVVRLGVVVGVLAGLVGSAGDVEAGSLNGNLDVDLVQVLGHTEESGREVLGGLDHSVLALGSEHGDGALR